MTFEHEIHTALHDLHPLIIGRDVRTFDQIDSTNTFLRDQAQRGAIEGMLAIADEQTSGRGRLGRSWNAPAGSSILMSVLLRPTWLAVNDSFLLTILAAVVLAEAIERTTNLEIGIKWPNDIQIQGRKVAGILVDLEMQTSERIQWAVIGTGINLNWHPDPAEIKQPATSLSNETGQNINRAMLLQAIVRGYDQRYLALRNGHHEALRTAWIQRLTTLGQPVTVEAPSETFEGTAESVTSDGGLQVRRTNGNLQTVYAGDVRVRG